MNTKIDLSIVDTPYTIDTYSTFTMDDDENMIEDGKTYDDYEWEYNSKEYVQALAENWQVLMRENILDPIIKNITVTGSAYSPREYNFTTDNAPVSIEYDQEALHAYINKNKERYNKEKRHSYDGYIWLGDDEDAMIIWYMETVSTCQFSTDDYFMDQRDKVSAYEYISMQEKTISA